MKEVTQWWKEIDGTNDAWLILGKGPSLERIREFDLQPFRTVSLNHVIQTTQVEVASVIDLDVVKECQKEIYENARFLLMPRYPHVNCRASERPLEGLFDQVSILRTLSQESRLIWYNFATGKPIPSSPLIPKGPFSAAVIVNLLAVLGVRSIRTLGIDGGTAYSAQFNEKTRLVNRHSNFDVQWTGIAATVRKHEINYAPLTSEVPMRVFIGTDDSQMIATKVLQYSITKHCPIPVVFDAMEQVEVPSPKDPKNQARTPFSFKRFGIPKQAGFKGRAVYLDADMLVLKNFQQLWDIPFDGAHVLYALSSDSRRRKQFSMLLLNCAELRWEVSEIINKLDEQVYSYDELMKELCLEPSDKVQPGIPPIWNSLEEYQRGETGLIHYTDMSTQPWVSCKNPYGDLWIEYLQEALRSGFLTFEEIEEARQLGFVRPSLLKQLKLSRRWWPFFRKVIAPFFDIGFKPHRKLKKQQRQALTGR